MKRSDTILIFICVAVIASVLIGQALLVASPYRCSINGDLTEDGAVYDIESNLHSNYAAMTFDSEFDYGLTEFVICYDYSHRWLCTDKKIGEAIEYLKWSLERCSVSVSVLTTDDIVRLMNENISNGSFNVGIIFVTGSLPWEIYDGSADSLIFDWLSFGGVMYWGNGTIGKYLSLAEGEDLVEVNDHNELFFGESNVIRDKSSSAFDRKYTEG